MLVWRQRIFEFFRCFRCEFLIDHKIFKVVQSLNVSKKRNQKLLKHLCTENIADTVYFIVYKLHCIFYMYFGFIVVSAMECTGIAAFTFTMWKIRSCLLWKLIHQKSLSFIYLQFCGYFLWVQSIEVNSVAVSSKQVQRFEGKWFWLR